MARNYDYRGYNYNPAVVAQIEYNRNLMNSAYGQRPQYQTGGGDFGDMLKNFMAARNDYFTRRDRSDARKGMNVEDPLGNGSFVQPDGSVAVGNYTPVQNPFSGLTPSGEGVSVSGDNNGFGKIFGGLDGGFVNPSNASDITEGQPTGETSPAPTTLQDRLDALPNAKYLSDDYSWDAYNSRMKDAGVADRMMRKMRYGMDVEPMRSAAKDEKLRELIKTYASGDSSKADKDAALEMLAVETGDPYFAEDRRWKQEDRGWKREDRGYDVQSKKLKLHNQQLSNNMLEFKLKAAMANGINPADAGLMMDENGFIVGGNPFGGTTSSKGTKTKGNLFTNPRKQLLDSSSALGKLGKQIAEAEEKLKDKNLSEEDRQKILDKLDGKNEKDGMKKQFEKAQTEYIKHITPYLYTKRFGQSGYDGLTDLYLLMKHKDKSGLSSMQLSDSIAKAARGVLTNGEVTVDDIQKEILDRANMREDVAQFDDIGDTDYGDFYRYEGVDPSNAQLNALASPDERLGQVNRLRDQGRQFAINDIKYGMYDRNLSDYSPTYGYGYNQNAPEDPLAPQGNLEILGNKVTEGDETKFVAPRGALPSINKQSVTNPIQRVRGGGWGARLGKADPTYIDDSTVDWDDLLGQAENTPYGNLVAQNMRNRQVPYNQMNGQPSEGYDGGGNWFNGNPFVENMRALIGWFPFRANDGTNCVRAVSTALYGTPYGVQADGKPLYNVDQVVAIAKQRGELRDPATYTPQAGDIAVTNWGGHVGMVTENGGVIQNGGSGEEVPLNVTTADGRRNGSVYEVDTPVAQYNEGVIYYIPTGQFLA